MLDFELKQKVPSHHLLLLEQLLWLVSLNRSVPVTRVISFQYSHYLHLTFCTHIVGRISLHLVVTELLLTCPPTLISPSNT